MATQKGIVGAVFGVKVTSVTVNTKTHEVIRTYNYSKEADTKEIRDIDGDVNNVTFYNIRERLTMDIVVTDATNTANALTDFVNMPAPGDDATLDVTAGDSQLSTASASFIVESAGKVASQDDMGTMSLTLVRYTNNLTTKT